MDAQFRYGGNDLPLVTGTAGLIRISLDEAPGGRALLDVTAGRGGDNLTVEQAETLGRALLSWAADMRLVSA
jgi:hypothetical protein